ncbi:MAG: YabP/YqfC family sporulation protein [Clostridia bacterium]|nr:YabP/YqfC family sporulation protein [Clostridia bacterium]
MSKFKKLINKAKYAASCVTYGEMIELHSDRLALISGCRRLCDYKKEKIVLELKNMNVEFVGEDLEPESLINGEMAIKGIIREVKYFDN